jgi:putative lipoprotein
MFSRRFFLVLLSFSATLPFACSPEPEPSVEQSMVTEEVTADPVAPPPDSDPLPLRAHVYECEDGSEVVAEFGVDDVALNLPERELTLPRVEAASGARFQDGDDLFWTRSDEAKLGFDGDEGETVTCVENRRRSAIESARRDGARFWGAGNEPGWTLRIYRDHILLLTDYGATRIQAPAAAPERLGGRTVYRTTSNDHDLTVTVRNAPCHDDMSGEPFSRTVEVVVDGKTLRGCGEAL